MFQQLPIVSADENVVRSIHYGGGQRGGLMHSKNLTAAPANSIVLQRAIWQDFLEEWVVLALLDRSWRDLAQAPEPLQPAQIPSAMSDAYGKIGLPKGL